MIIESLRIRNFRCFGDAPVIIDFEGNLTAFVGGNGSGKTTVIAAIQKLFGTRAEDRRLVREDVHFGPDEAPGVGASGSDAESVAPEGATAASEPPQLSPISSRQVEIEVVLALPELADPTANLDHIPDVFKAMSVADVGQPPKLRIRLEATWNYGIEDDDISTRMYWITSLADVPFGERDIAKVPFPPADRKRFQLRFLPATRDSNAIIRQAQRELLSWLEKFGDWSTGQEPMARQWEELQSLFDGMPAITTVINELEKTWAILFEGPHLKSPRLTVLAREIQRSIRDLTLTLGPGPAGRHRSLHDLSEGQSSLFYIALVVTLQKLDDLLAQSIPDGFRDMATLRPWLTIVALEEPENHLSPFYLSRMIGLMKELTDEPNVVGILTTHSASALRRLEPRQVRHLRHDPATLLSYANKIPLPPPGAAERKFVQEAVSVYPELYFAKLVILGEGRSEQEVLPEIARSLDPPVELDPSFVAFVPLGGRHVNHFWRLLRGLHIPYLTLLDYDLGRYNAGPLRVKYAVDQLVELGGVVPAGHPMPANAEAWRTMDQPTLSGWVSWLEQQGVYFSRDLDLDMMMVQAFPTAYGDVSGVTAADAADDYRAAVFGKSGAGVAAYPAGQAPSQLQLAQYEALFKKGSKPVAHVEALAKLETQTIRESCPATLQRLFAHCRARLKAAVEADGEA